MLKWFCNLFTITILTVSLYAQPVAAEEISLDELRMLEVFDLLKTHHISEPNDQNLSYAAVQGMVASLQDPYTAYFSDEELDYYLDSIEGQFSGVGIVVGDEQGIFTIYEVYPGSPAEVAGIRAGDQLRAVDGLSVSGQAFETVMSQVSGLEGTSVSLTLSRDGQSYTVQLERAMMQLPQVYAELLPEEIGYIYLSTFTEYSFEQYKQALSSLKKQGAQAIILDLRDNPGGLLDAANQVASSFIQKGALTIVKNSEGKEYPIPILQSVEKETLPLAVLVNEYSASASEIVAAALQDYKRATIIGSGPTFGKGTIQELVPLYFGGYLKMTVEEYFSPLHKPMNHVGVTPDLLVQDEHQQLQAAIDHLQRVINQKSVMID
ncbi:hypothetical protein BEP19_13545 [Ammoniphilus oxalaticus]|uniref:PDZ domain-containing protein n=1 Tax=Ammoniphilus oxalaticus TaxID=66863 RepID=A0A419SFD3_9BACL|nr:S41 family peptidase [Ammoniphilus oxalaticus]RKD22088.1 hypothetical protein BEP19_13545 [Ammoniphilus oxalaticus]